MPRGQTQATTEAEAALHAKAKIDKLNQEILQVAITAKFKKCCHMINMPSPL